MVTKQQLIRMRRYLPQTEYRIVKNRKSARLCRLKRKMDDKQLVTKMNEYELLNRDLLEQVNHLKEKLDESEAKNNLL